MSGKITHGLSRTKLYKTWSNMKDRCYNTRNKRYNRYGGRGITVCDEWRDDFKIFYNWAIINGYSEKLTIERKDNNGNYCPENCCWIEMVKQVKNRNISINLTIGKETKSINEWAKDCRCQVSENSIRKRLNKGWSAEDAVIKPEMSTVERGRKNKNSIKITAFSETKTFYEWELDPRCKVTKGIIYGRIKIGWEPEMAIITPKKY